MVLAGEQVHPRPVFSPTIDAVVRESPCDIAVVKQRGVEQVRSILVPVRGGPHAELAIRISRDLARRFGATVHVLHVVPKGIGERAVAHEQAAVDAFVREHLLLELPLFPVRSDLPFESDAATTTPPDESGAAPDPRLAPLAALASQLKKTGKLPKSS